MAYKINGTTVVDNSRNVCACCVTSCCVTASTRLDAPSGTTASRPGTPATGSLYFDTDEGSLIAYDGSAWSAVGGGGYPSLSHCTFVVSVASTTTQDRQVKAPVAFNNVVGSITGSYKASGNYATSYMVLIKPTGTIMEFPSCAGGGGSGGIANVASGQTYVSPDLNYYSFATGGESNFCTPIKAFGFDMERQYKMQSCNCVNSTNTIFLGKFGNCLFGIHPSGHFGWWCCNGTLKCMGYLQYQTTSYNQIMGLFETCSGDIGVIQACQRIVHLCKETLAVQCAWCFCETNESMDLYGGFYRGIAQTTEAVGIPMRCCWGMIWDKVSCNLYKMNLRSSTCMKYLSSPLNINDQIYYASLSCDGTRYWSFIEHTCRNGCRPCYGYIFGGNAGFWNESSHCWLAQGFGPSMLAAHFRGPTGTAAGTCWYAALSDVKTCITGFKNPGACCLNFSTQAVPCSVCCASSLCCIPNSCFTVTLGCCNCLCTCLRTEYLIVT